MRISKRSPRTRGGVPWRAALVALVLLAAVLFASPAQSAPTTHTVASGESLHLIGRNYSVPWEDIARWNSISSPYTIYVGQVLYVSDPGADPPPSPPGPTPTPSPTPAPSCSAGTVRLTFDDGPSTDITPAILSILRDKSVKATFFVLGAQGQANSALLRQEAAEGHRIGNHTWTHRRLTQLKASEVRQELSSTSNLIQQQTGVRPVEFRPPFGATSGTVQSIAAEYGLRQQLWTIDPEDWAYPSAQQLYDRIVPHAVNGSVVVMHDAYSSSLYGLAGVIDGLRERGFCFA